MMKQIDGNGSVPRHLDDADLISHLDGELDHAEQKYAGAHLKDCWHCRSRRQAIQNSIESFLRTRNQIMPAEFPPAGLAMTQFRRRLAQHRSAPVSFHLSQWLQSILSAARAPQFVLTHQRVAFAVLLILLGVGLLLLAPFRWNAASADELLTMADAYEFLNERPSGKVICIKTRLDRINLTTHAEQNLAELESTQDSLSRAVFISQAGSNGVTRTKTIADRDKPESTDAFTSEFDTATAGYLSSQGWLPHVSAAVYKRLIGGRGLNSSDGASVTREGSVYEIHHLFRPGHLSQISETVLKLSSANYAPQAVSIFTVEGDERFEYRFTRKSMEKVERTPEMAKLFELPGKSTGLPSISGSKHPNAESAPEVKATIPENVAVASAGLEVEVLSLLHQAGADLGEQITVTREVDGPIRVNGIVETDQRKNDILRGLKPVSPNPAVHIDVKTVAEALAARRDQRDGQRATTIEGVEIAADTFPAYQDLRARMSDEEARIFAARMVSSSHSAMRHAWALDRLMSHFTVKDLAAMPPEAHAKWIELIKGHARAFAAESGNLREQLQLVFNVESAGASPASSPNDDAELIRAVERLTALAKTNYQIVRSAFIVTREHVAFTAIKSPQFWQSMRTAEAIATAIGTVAKR